MIVLSVFVSLLLFFLLLKVMKRKITVGIWSIKVFNSDSILCEPPHEELLGTPTLRASDVTDVPAEFIADPFIVIDGSKFLMFFEVLDKSSNKGIIGLATSDNGEKWTYERIVLKESFHLSYPYVFKFQDQFYMIPETSEAKQVVLYRAKSFPYEWQQVCVLINESYVDSSIFQYKDKWWMFASKSGRLHLFYSEKLEGDWLEHPKSPVIMDNFNITRPGGRVVVNNDDIYRYTQNGRPNYGTSVRVFRITQLSELDYQEEEINDILTGSNQDDDWRKDGMHSIDHLKLSENKWIIAVDGHKLLNRNYLLWKLGGYKAKFQNLVLKAFRMRKSIIQGSED